MSGLDDLYQSVILDHDRSPRNFRELDPDGRQEAEGYNPLCGDRFRVMVRVEDGIVREVTFLGSGCAISKASASLMTEAVKGRTVAETERLFEAFQGLFGASPADSASLPARLRVFEGVRQYPMRVKCATLAWHAMRRALGREGVGGREDVRT